MQAITLQWPGGEHAFALPLGQLRALQEATSSGPEEVWNRIRVGVWRVDDVISVLRFGLVGGGMESEVAARLVVTMFDLHPMADFKLPALAVMRHAMLGPEDDVPGKPEGATLPPESGNSHASTETPPSSDSRRGKSTK